MRSTARGPGPAEPWASWATRCFVAVSAGLAATAASAVRCPSDHDDAEPHRRPLDASRFARPRRFGVDHPRYAELLDRAVRPGVRYFSGAATYEKDASPSPRPGWARRAAVAGPGGGGEFCDRDPERPAPAGAVEAAVRRRRHRPAEARREPTTRCGSANFWANRMIGDLAAGRARRHTFAPIRPSSRASPLSPSGLRGPVTLAAPGNPVTGFHRSLPRGSTGMITPRCSWRRALAKNARAPIAIEGKRNDQHGSRTPGRRCLQPGLVMALGGVAHAGEAMATATGPPAPPAEAAPMAQGQDAAATNDNAVTEVVVTGFLQQPADARSGTEAQQHRRRSTRSWPRTSPSSPTTTLAEAIQRVPGVAISRDGGEGRALVGAGPGSGLHPRAHQRHGGPGLHRRLHAAPTAAGASTSTSSPPNSSTSIDVRKTPSADVEEGSLGATVDLTTGHPFDYQAASSWPPRPKEGYNDQTEKTWTRAWRCWSATPSADDKLGALFSIAYSQGTRRNFQQSSSGLWNQGNGDGGWCRPTATTRRHLRRAGRRLRQRHLDLQPGQRAHDLLSALHALRAGPGQDRAPGPDRLAAMGAGRGAPRSRWTACISRYKVSRDDWPLEAIGFSRGASQGGKPEMPVRT